MLFKEKIVKDVNGPKPAMKSMAIFYNEKKEEIKAAHPEMKNPHKLQKEGKTMWQGLTVEEKAPYEALQIIDKARADRERAEYKSTSI
jgi:hypothetical protein